MRSATILGFRVVVNPVWLLVFALLIVSLVTSVPSTGPTPLAGPPALAVAVIVVALFLATIVIHELAHALAARSLGLPVQDVQLLTLGRPIAPETEPSSPRAEVLVAAAGPIVSAIIAGALLLGSFAFPAEAEAPLSLVYWTVYWLALANVGLALFHLVPVLPLDGGRIVRAISWRLSDDLDRATAWTGTVGRAFGYALVGTGALAALAVDVFLGIWLVLLGWFAGRLSRLAIDRRRMEQLTADLTVADATDLDPATISPALTLETLRQQDEQGDGPGVYPVLDGQGLQGFVFLSRVRRRWGADDTRRVADVMVAAEQAPSLAPDEPLFSGVARLESTRAAGLPVMVKGEPPRLVGLLTRDRVMERLRARQALLEIRDGSTSRAGGG